VYYFVQWFNALDDGTLVTLFKLVVTVYTDI